MHPDDMTFTATPGEAHREWHRNAGVPMGTPGCPQDACHLPDDYDADETPAWVVTDHEGYRMEFLEHQYDGAVNHARAMARTLGRTFAVRRYAAVEVVTPAPSLHDTPCVCGPYDRCQGVRLQDARDVAHLGRNAMIRAQHRAYND